MPPCPASCTCPGDLYVADGCCLIRRILASNRSVSSVAGTAGLSGWSPDGPATSALLSNPMSLTLGPGGASLVWADTSTCVLRRLDLTPGGGSGVSMLAGVPRSCGTRDGPALLGAQLGCGMGSNNPQKGLAFFGDDLFVADSCNNAIRKLNSATGNLTTLATTGVAINWPVDIIIDAAAQIYFTQFVSRAAVMRKAAH